jgi:trk system potassium uptake protein TrkA
MRLAIVGATAVGEATARLLIDHGHDVVIVEKDRQRIDDLSEDLDCAFVHGDGSRPRILREVGATDTDALLCLSDDDQDNIISSLVGATLGFGKVMTKISDPEFEHICAELGLQHTISADLTTARSLVDTVEGRNVVELSTVLRGDVRFFMFTARAEDAGPPEALKLPEDTRVLYAYRGNDLRMVGEGFEVQEGDDVVLLTRSGRLNEFVERWGAGSVGKA